MINWHGSNQGGFIAPVGSYIRLKIIFLGGGIRWRGEIYIGMSRSFEKVGIDRPDDAKKWCEDKLAEVLEDAKKGKEK